MQLVISPDAKLDLQGIWNHIAADNVAAAIRFQDRLAARFDLICTSPESGEERLDLAAGIRQAIVGQYVIFYRVTQNAVRVLRILHGARRLPEAFHQPP